MCLDATVVTFNVVEHPQNNLALVITRIINSCSSTFWPMSIEYVTVLQLNVVTEKHHNTYFLSQASSSTTVNLLHLLWALVMAPRVATGIIDQQAPRPHPPRLPQDTSQVMRPPSCHLLFFLFGVIKGFSAAQFRLQLNHLRMDFQFRYSNKVV